jgi:hypothetical protein
MFWDKMFLLWMLVSVWGVCCLLIIDNVERMIYCVLGCIWVTLGMLCIISKVLS